MFIQDNNNYDDEKKHEHKKHYLIIIIKNKLKFYLSLSDSYFKRLKKSLNTEGEIFKEATNFKLDFKFGYYERFYEKYGYLLSCFYCLSNLN